jgi:predicted RNase H-like HicB family nuclease
LRTSPCGETEIGVLYIDMKNIIQFSISKGDKYYTAEGVGVPVFTQGSTLDELVANIKEAVDLHFEDEDFSEYGFAPNPSLLINFEMPQYA